MPAPETEEVSSKKTGSARRKPVRVALAAGSGLIGLLVLTALAWEGGNVRDSFHLSMPGPVVGLMALSLVVLLAERFHAWSSRHLALHVMPVSRVLVSHLGLLFVPAGVGIITQGAVLRREWLPIVAALLGSTLVGLVATGWVMQRFAPKKQGPRT